LPTMAAASGERAQAISLTKGAHIAKPLKA